MLKRWVQDVRLYLASVFAQCGERGTRVADGGSKAEAQGQEDHKTKPFEGTHNKELGTRPTTSDTQPHATEPCALAQGAVEGAKVAHGESNTHTQPHATQTGALSAEQDVHIDDGAPAGVDGTTPLGPSPQHSAQKRGACTAPAGAEGDCKRHCPCMSC
jgi:hypothetical protein